MRSEKYTQTFFCFCCCCLCYWCYRHHCHHYQYRCCHSFRKGKKTKKEKKRKRFVTKLCYHQHHIMSFVSCVAVRTYELYCVCLSAFHFHFVVQSTYQVYTIHILSNRMQSMREEKPACAHTHAPTSYTEYCTR